MDQVGGLLVIQKVRLEGFIQTDSPENRVDPDIRKRAAEVCKKFGPCPGHRIDI